MKKIWVAVLLALITSFITSCNYNATQYSENDEPTNFSEENENEENEKSEKTESLWELKYYVDEFKTPTDEKYIQQTARGTFSNSATTNSNLLVKFLVDNENITIALYEYGRMQVKNSSSLNSEEYNITMRVIDDTKIKLSGTMYRNGDRIVISSNDIETVLSELNLQNGNTTIDFYIEESDWKTTKYLFAIEKSDFVEQYKLLTE